MTREQYENTITTIQRMASKGLDLDENTKQALFKLSAQIMSYEWLERIDTFIDKALEDEVMQKVSNVFPVLQEMKKTILKLKDDYPEPTLEE